MVRAVRAALMRLMAPLAAKVHCKEARHILCGLAAVAAVFPPLAEFPPAAQRLSVVAAQVGSGA